MTTTPNETPNEPEPQGLPHAPPAAESAQPAAGPTGPAPQIVQISFWAWIVAAVFYLISPIVVFTRRDTILEQARQQDTRGLTPEQLETSVTVLLVAGIVIGVVLAALAVVLAMQMRAGRNWARITLTVLGIIAVILMLLFGAQLGWVGALAGVVAIVLMYVGPARAYFTPSRQLAS